MTSSKQTSVHVNGTDINVIEAGSGSPALIFLHIFAGSVKGWADVIAELKGTHRCVAMDFRGWGESGKGLNDYTLEGLASDVDAVARKLGVEDYILVGHSMGGKVAQIVAAARPVGLKALVLVAPAPPTPVPTPKEVRAHIQACVETREGVASVLPMLTDVATLKHEHREFLIEDAIIAAPEAKREWFETGMDFDLTGRASLVNVPVRVIIGGNDQIETEAALRTAFDAHYPGTDYVVVPRAGHLIPLEAPEAVANAIRTARTA